MRSCARLVAVFLLLVLPDASGGQTIYHGVTVDSPELRVELRPQGEDRFAILLSDKVNGRQVSHVFGAEGATDPEPLLMVSGRYCDTSVILLTIQFPWRHALPQYARTLATYAFRTSDLAYIDMTMGPLTDITLLDNHAEGTDDSEMQPPVLVQCLSDPLGGPFRFERRR